MGRLSGAAPGTHIFSAFYQNMADFASATETLIADAQYLDGVTEARQHLVAPPEDRHIEILHTAGGEYQRPGLGGIVQLTTATAALGKLAAAVGWGVQVAELVAEIIGEPVFFGRSLAGPFGELAWVGASADARAWDRTQEALTKTLATSPASTRALPTSRADRAVSFWHAASPEIETL